MTTPRHDPDPEGAPLADLQAASFGHTLLAAARLYDQRGQARLNEALGEEIARPSVMRLAPWLDASGIRPSELARRTDVTKQAVGQTLAEMERRGLVASIPDPTDGRARLVRLTPKGEAAFGEGLAALARVERELEGEVGRAALDATFRGLQRILRALEGV